MVGAFTFPGVYTQEQDFSLYVPALTSMNFGIVTTASKGPVNQPILCATEEQLINNFSFPSTAHKGLLAGQQYLRTGNQLWVVRVAGYDEATASAMLRNEDDNADAVALFASSSGTWANSSATSRTGVSVQVTEGDIENYYTLLVRLNGYLVEEHRNVSLTPSDADFIETRLADSSYVSAEAEVGATDLKIGTVYFSGGDDGLGVTPADYVGQVVGGNRSGLKLFADPRISDVNTVAAPGVDDASVIAELISLAESRQDCVALPDPPFGLNEQQIVEWHNGVLSGSDKYPTVSLNSSYAGLFWPYCKVFDSYHNENVWAPPSGFAAQAFAYTDQFYESWYAPAGIRRGRLPQVIETEIVPEVGAGNYMYGGRAGQFGINAVNPIMNFVGEGAYIWGQRTLQRTPTSLDRLNVRRMLNKLRKVVATSVRYLTFEPNDEAMWDDFKSLVKPFLRTIKNGRGLRDYRVYMDETTNPDSLREQNQALGRILLKPTKTAEVINVNFALLPQGANFDEFITTTA